MAKKKKEVCPYCGKSFAYLSRHKCKVKERMEGIEDTDKSDVERRIERIEERKKEFTRSLKKDEKSILKMINMEKQIYFNDLLKLSNKKRSELDDILDILALQSKIKVKRELLDASWTKLVSAIEDIEVPVKDIKINMKKKDFILEIFSYQPCIICPFASKCNETNLDQFNPHHCPWLTDWINASLEGRIYKVNFDKIQSEILD
ncbi:MAG: hypothetical protein ACFE85_15150 [Candidatus Hodarchaeota archaeon]